MGGPSWAKGTGVGKPGGVFAQLRGENQKRASYAEWGQEGSASLDVSDDVPCCPPGAFRPHSTFLPSIPFHIPLARVGGPP